jgi:xanthine dehydrogenase iron-sulfur cluster and FAD-binding subunit A
MLMAAAALLHQHDSPTDEQINSSITNICRCGTYPRVRAAIHKAAASMHAAQNPIAFSISIGRWGAILKTVQGSKAAGYATEVAV